MTSEHTREILQRYADALLSFGDFGRYLADDVTMTFMGTGRAVSGRGNVVEAIKFMHEVAFSSAITVRGLVCGNGEAMLEAEFVGTHVGEFEGIQPKLRAVHVPYSVAYTLADGRITALRLYFPFDLLLRQLTDGAETAAA